jgi:small-conductance mechanosensitive channel/CRP-like cAMP-binding protein
MSAAPQTGEVGFRIRRYLAPGIVAVAAVLLALLWYRVLAVLPWVTARPLSARVGEAVPVAFGAVAFAMLAQATVPNFMVRVAGLPPTRMVRQLVSALCWIVTIAIVGAIFLNVPVGSLVTTSGLLLAAIGVALKDVIADALTGLALPIKIGDWIEVDGQLGRVIEISWRATRLLTPDRITVNIPNTHLTAKLFKNLSQPEPYYRDAFKVVLDHGVTTHQAERILLAAARQVEAIQDIPYRPDARITAFTDRGIEWELRYYVPDAGVAWKVRYQVQRNLLRNLHYSGIALPYPVLIRKDAPPREQANEPADEVRFLRGVELFDSLSDAELRSMVKMLALRLKLAGAPLVRQGEAGDSLFVLREGLWRVSIARPEGGGEIELAQLAPGSFVGEMSLLTGAPRSATVTPVIDSMCYEITREILAPLMESRPELAQQLSDVLAERQLRNNAKLEASANVNEVQKRSLTEQILGRINAFFRLRSAAE